MTSARLELAVMLSALAAASGSATASEIAEADRIAVAGQRACAAMASGGEVSAALSELQVLSAPATDIIAEAGAAPGSAVALRTMTASAYALTPSPGSCALILAKDLADPAARSAAVAALASSVAKKPAETAAPAAKVPPPPPGTAAPNPAAPVAAVLAAATTQATPATTPAAATVVAAPAISAASSVAAASPPTIAAPPATAVSAPAAAIGPLTPEFAPISTVRAAIDVCGVGLRGGDVAAQAIKLGLSTVAAPKTYALPNAGATGATYRVPSKDGEVWAYTKPEDPKSCHIAVAMAPGPTGALVGELLAKEGMVKGLVGEMDATTKFQQFTSADFKVFINLVTFAPPEGSLASPVRTYLQVGAN